MVAGRLGLSTEIGKGIVPPTTGFIETTVKNVKGLFDNVIDSIKGLLKYLTNHLNQGQINHSQCQNLFHLIKSS